MGARSGDDGSPAHAATRRQSPVRTRARLITDMIVKTEGVSEDTLRRASPSVLMFRDASGHAADRRPVGVCHSVPAHPGVCPADAHANASGQHGEVRRAVESLGSEERLWIAWLRRKTRELDERAADKEAAPLHRSRHVKRHRSPPGEPIDAEIRARAAEPVRRDLSSQRLRRARTRSQRRHGSERHRVPWFSPIRPAGNERHPAQSRGPTRSASVDSARYHWTPPVTPRERGSPEAPGPRRG